MSRENILMADDVTAGDYAALESSTGGVSDVKPQPTTPAKKTYYKSRLIAPFEKENEPFTLAEIASALNVKYEAVRSARRRLEAKPETHDKVSPIGESRHAEYSAEAANFIARRCLKNSDRNSAAI